MTGRPRISCGLVLVSLAIAGCGGTSAKTTGRAAANTVGGTSSNGTDGTGASTSGGTGAAGSGTSLTQFVARAAHVCEGVRVQDLALQKREEALKHVPVEQAKEAFVTVAREAASIARSADKQLQALPRPTADGATIAQVLQAYSEEATDASNIANAAIGQENGIGEAATHALAKSVARNSATAKKLGMGDCFTP